VAHELSWPPCPAPWPGVRRAGLLKAERGADAGPADVAFTMKQYVQTDLEADRRVATTLAELIIGGSVASTEVAYQARGSQGKWREA
jgi:hypothetical protein